MSDQEIIARRRDEFVAAFNREDVNVMEGFLSDDHVGTPPNRPPILGREASVAFWREGLAAAKSEFTVIPQELEVIGDVAIDRFHWAVEITPRKGGAPGRDEGDCVWMWRRQKDGEWKLASAIWNSNLPQPGLWTGAAASRPDDVAVINECLNRYVAALNNGDPESLAKTLTGDFVFMPPDAPPVTGKEAVTAAVKAAFLDPYELRLRAKFDDLQVFGSDAVARGNFSVAMAPKAGGDRIEGIGKFINMFRKQADGSWKYAVGMFNYDKPLA